VPHLVAAVLGDIKSGYIYDFAFSAGHPSLFIYACIAFSSFSLSLSRYPSLHRFSFVLYYIPH